MNYSKLTARLSKEEIGAIYMNWLERRYCIVNRYCSLKRGWQNDKAVNLAHELHIRLINLSNIYGVDELPF